MPLLWHTPSQGLPPFFHWLPVKMLLTSLILSLKALFTSELLRQEQAKLNEARKISVVNVNPTNIRPHSDTPEIRKYKKRFNSEILCAALWGTLVAFVCFVFHSLVSLPSSIRCLWLLSSEHTRRIIADRELMWDCLRTEQTQIICRKMVFKMACRVMGKSTSILS